VDTVRNEEYRFHMVTRSELTQAPAPVETGDRGWHVTTGGHVPAVGIWTRHGALAERKEVIQ
jgi:hypothetical protein